MSSMNFTVNGKDVVVNAGDVQHRLRAVVPENVQKHGVRVNGVVYPVKQALAAATGLSRNDFTSQTARRLLGRLGFELTGSSTPTLPSDRPAPGDSTNARAWPWEGEVQRVFAGWLVRHEWSVTGLSDTATKQHGVDLLAAKGGRRLGAEVKGWPSTSYADPRRAQEVKRTQPTTQAGHWFSQALMKAMMLLDTHPDHESLIVLPDYPRYRALAQRTRTGRAAAQLHVVFVQANGDACSDTWES